MTADVYYVTAIEIAFPGQDTFTVSCPSLSIPPTTSRLRIPRIIVQDPSVGIVYVLRHLLT